MADLAGPLVHRKLLRHIVDEVFRGGIADDEGHNPLTQIRIRQADDGDLVDPRVPQQCRLDLAGADPVAAGFDQIHRLAADDPVHPVGADDRGVTGAVPPIGRERRLGGVGPVEVTLEHGGSADLKAADGVPVVRYRRAVLPDESGRHTRQRPSDPARAAFPIGPGAHRDEGLGAPVALDRGVPGQFGQPAEHRHRQRCAAGHQQAGPGQRPRRFGVGDDPRPHRGYPEVQRSARRRIGLRGRPAGVHEAAADPQRPQQSEHQTVHVEQRQTVHQGVLGGPLPGLRQGVEVGGDGPAADHRTLGRAGGSGGVDDHGGGLRPRLGVTVPGPGVQPDRHVRQARRVLRSLTQPGLGAGVGENVVSFGHPDVGGDRDERNAGDQTSGDRQHGRRGGGREHRDPTGSPDPFGHRSRRPDQVAARERDAVDAHRVTDIGARGDRSGIQRGQQHLCEATASPGASCCRCDR